MVGNVGNILTPVLNQQVTALQRSARTANELQLQLATGKRVNSALDNPQNFFNALSLENRSADLSRLLDGLTQSLRTIQVADSGVRAVNRILQQAEAQAEEGRVVLTSSTTQPLNELILADEPVAYYRLNEDSSTNTAVNLGTAGATLNATYQNVGANERQGEAFYVGGDVTANLDGSNNTRVRIPNNALINTDPAGYPERTIELTFRASDTNGRQVLYEEGGTGNAIAIYIDNGRVYTTARDAGDFGPFDISGEIEAGETYHVALTLDAPNNTFTGYLNGEVIGTGFVNRPLSRHGARVAIGGLDGGTFFHDGAQGGNGLNYRGQIAEVAIYNDVISGEGIRERFDSTQIENSKFYAEQVALILEQLDPLVEDTSYRGVNLLSNDDLVTDFNEERDNQLITEGVDFSSSGLGLEEFDFRNLARVDLYLADNREAVDQVRSFGRSLATDLSIIETRQSFKEKTINTLEAGADDLTVADQNELGAELLASQVRQEIQFSVLSFGAQSSTAIADLIQSSALSA